MMKRILIFILFLTTGAIILHGQNVVLDDKQKQNIYLLIDQYSQAREKRDTILLKSILTTDVDQLVSTGEWRSGVASSLKGMLSSSANSPGTRTLNIAKIRLLDRHSAIVDCKYEIQSTDGVARKMWSTFIIVSNKGTWKISAIRNMLPAVQ